MAGSLRSESRRQNRSTYTAALRAHTLQIGVRRPFRSHGSTFRGIQKQTGFQKQTVIEIFFEDFQKKNWRFSKKYPPDVSKFLFEDFQKNLQIVYLEFSKKNVSIFLKIFKKSAFFLKKMICGTLKVSSLSVKFKYRCFSE